MKRALLIMVLLGMLVLAGCTSGDSSTSSPIQSSTPFIGGNTGLLVSFLTGSPPPQTFDSGSSSFSVSLQLENMGESDIEPANGYVELRGINPIDFGLPNQEALKKNFPMTLQRSRKAPTGDLLPGGKGVISFEDLRYIPDLSGNNILKIRADVCYDYKTKTSTKVCIKDDVLGIDESEICRITENKDPQNSGGPIQIDLLKETPLSNDKIQLIFEISHVGDASNSFFAVSALKCDDKITNPNRYKVYVKVTSDVNGVFPKCNGLQNKVSDYEGYVTLYDKQPATVVCDIDLANVDSDFEDLFNVELTYKYQQSIETTIEVRDVSGLQ